MYFFRCSKKPCGDEAQHQSEDFEEMYELCTNKYKEYLDGKNSAVSGLTQQVYMLLAVTLLMCIRNECVYIAVCVWLFIVYSTTVNSVKWNWKYLITSGLTYMWQKNIIYQLIVLYENFYSKDLCLRCIQYLEICVVMWSAKEAAGRASFRHQENVRRHSGTTCLTWDHQDHCWLTKEAEAAAGHQQAAEGSWSFPVCWYKVDESTGVHNGVW